MRKLESSNGCFVTTQEVFGFIDQSGYPKIGMGTPQLFLGSYGVPCGYDKTQNFCFEGNKVYEFYSYSSKKSLVVSVLSYFEEDEFEENYQQKLVIIPSPKVNGFVGNENLGLTTVVKLEKLFSEYWQIDLKEREADETDFAFAKIFSKPLRIGKVFIGEISFKVKTMSGITMRFIHDTWGSWEAVIPLPGRGMPARVDLGYNKPLYDSLKEKAKNILLARRLAAIKKGGVAQVISCKGMAKVLVPSGTLSTKGSHCDFILPNNRWLKHYNYGSGRGFGYSYSLGDIADLDKINPIEMNLIIGDESGLAPIFGARNGAFDDFSNQI